MYRLDDTRRIHGRNKYGVKRARIPFTGRYNCQKNKRSQSLFAHVFLHRQRETVYSSYPVFRFYLPTSIPPRISQLHPPFGCRLLLSPLSFIYLSRAPTHIDTRTPSRRLSIAPVYISSFFLLSILDFQPPRRDSPVEKLTRVAGQRIRNYDLSR